MPGEQAAYDKDGFPESAESQLMYYPVTTRVRPQLCKFYKLCVVEQLLCPTMAACCNISRETQQERSDDPKSHASGRKADSLSSAVDFGLYINLFCGNLEVVLILTAGVLVRTPPPLPAGLLWTTLYHSNAPGLTFLCPVDPSGVLHFIK